MHIVLLKCPHVQIAFLKLWQWGFSRVYSDCCYSSSFELEIIKIGQSSHKMYSNNIVNFQESTTILNACTKKSGNLLNAPCIYIKGHNLVKLMSFRVMENLVVDTILKGLKDLEIRGRVGTIQITITLSDVYIYVIGKPLIPTKYMFFSFFL